MAEIRFPSVILRHPKQADNKVATPSQRLRKLLCGLQLWVFSPRHQAAVWADEVASGHRWAAQEHVQPAIYLPEIQTQRTSEKTARVSRLSNPVGCKRKRTKKVEEMRQEKRNEMLMQRFWGLYSTCITMVLQQPAYGKAWKLPVPGFDDLYGKRKPSDEALWRWSHVIFSTFAAFFFI